MLEFLMNEHYFLQSPSPRMLKSSSSSGSTSGYENSFIDGSETYYNDYAQAWRLIGFYTDCNAPYNNNNECDGSGNNDYESEDYYYGGGGDDDFVYLHNVNQNAPCQRYLLWAAYVDPSYEGGGIGEYSFFDRSTDSWNTDSCEANGNYGNKCKRMDCHLAKNSGWELLGIFKEPNYHEWMEQLFKHQGVCLWTNDEYYFMDNGRELWPCSCTASETYDSENNLLYYDTKPMPEGRITIGLYTDKRCRYDYTGELDVATVLSQVEDRRLNSNDYGSSTYDLFESLEKWNNAFDVYKICQPCKAYDLGWNTDLSQNEEENRQNNNNNNGDDDGYGNIFSCYDDAGYTNVNQCMKFKTKTEMIAADFRDIMLAEEQGTVVEFELLNRLYGYGGFTNDGSGELNQAFQMEDKHKVLQPHQIAIFVSSTVFLIASLYACYVARRRNQQMKNGQLQEPLVD